MPVVYRAEREPAILLQQLSAIRALADKEKAALGFLPDAAYREAIEKRRLVAMFARHQDATEVVGFILFSGVFPNARIQQIVVAPEHRRARVASTLLNDLVSQLEAQGYLTVTAAVASDLAVAQAFYEHNGFTPRFSEEGGQARNRKIIIRARELETESFFSLLDPRAPSPTVTDLGLRQRSASQAPLYAIDLNVFFDAIKGHSRPRSPNAERLIAAALSHQIRLAVAAEFIKELERNTKYESPDPVLTLARQLPRLPSTDRRETEKLASLIHRIVFVDTNSSQAGTLQAMSDARHLAEAALARASGYVTSDSQLLNAREHLLRDIGIDVANLDEFVALLPVDFASHDRSHLKGTDCTVKLALPDLARKYLKTNQIAAYIIEEFAPDQPVLSRWKAVAVSEAGDLVGIGIILRPNNVDSPARVLVHVRPDHVAFELFADYLVETQCYEACRSGPITIEMPHIAGQTTVRRAAVVRGFLPLPKADTLIKVALGRPVTVQSWPSIARQTRRRTGLRLPESAPDAGAIQSGFVVYDPNGKPLTVRLGALEDALGPTILVWPGRGGVVVPIAKSYADDLLGTGDQFPLFGSPQAAFLGRRTYFNSPRTFALMRPRVPILFYEFKRSGGRGAVVAAARIVDATVFGKQQVPEDLLRRAVVEDLEPISATKDVLATAFDNLLKFPTPVSLETLRAIGAAGASNLRTTTALSNAALEAVLEMGWSNA